METEMMKKIISFKVGKAMRRSLLVLFAVSFSLLWLESPAQAVPKIINYQGRLTDNQNIPKDTPVGITFSIFNNATSGTVPIWSETKTVPINNGVFSVQLGADPLNLFPPTMFDSDSRYLEIAVDAQKMNSPGNTRQRLPSAPYAIRAGRVKWADIDGIPDDFLDGDQLGLESASWADVTDVPPEFQDGDQTGISNTMISGMIAFFEGDCPPTWTDYEGLQGRTVVGLYPTGTPLSEIGAELNNKEVRSHSHAGLTHSHPYTGTVTGTSGNSNPLTDPDGNHTHAGGYSVSSSHDHSLGTSNANTTGNSSNHEHPVLARTNFNSGNPVPSPNHDHTYNRPQNRTGSPNNGGSSFSGTSGDSGGDHRHSVNNHGHNVNHLFSGSIDNNAANTTTPAAFTIPYIQLRACKKI